MKQRHIEGDDTSGVVVIARAVLATAATLILASFTVDVPPVDPVAVVTSLLRILMG